MHPPLLQKKSLEPHPDARNPAVRAITARIARGERDPFSVTYELEGELDRLNIPEPRASRRADQLWKHTCFELFVKSREESAYHELNFSPSTEWAAYSFARYREPVPLTDARLNVSIAVRRSARALELDASVDIAVLSPRYRCEPLMVAVSAVIEARDGTLSYWALAHPAGKPDFHHPDAFILELDEVRN
jgi:hypothetical protein